MIIYAIFMCVRISTSCQLAQPPWIDAFGDLHRSPVYRSLTACEQAILDTYANAQNAYPPPKLDANGRYVMAPGIWYECRHRHIDTWSSN